MAKRKIIKIDETLCNGCGICLPNCPEGAIQIIDDRARLVSDLFCDGLGSCLGHCPQGAITIEEREAVPYDEETVMANIVKAGPGTVKAHLIHLKEHGEAGYLKTALEYLKKNQLEVPEMKKEKKEFCGCPGARTVDFARPAAAEEKTDGSGGRPSQLRQWPLQLHLVSPGASYFQGKDVLLAADCVAYAVGDFHQDYLKGKGLAIACPKLDAEQEIYLDKIKSLIEDSKINTLTVMIMEVPCCGGLLGLVQKAQAETSRKVPLKLIVVGLTGEIIKEEWL